MAGQIVLTAASSGTVTLTPADTGNAFVVTLPAETGNIITTGTTTRIIPKAAMPAGTILQVVQSTVNTVISTSSTTYQASGLIANITPTTSSSKILVSVTGGAPGINAPNVGGDFSLYRKIGAGSYSSVTGSGADWFLFASPPTSGQLYAPHSFTYLDSPASVSTVSYQPYYRTSPNGTAGTTAFNVNIYSVYTAVVTLTLMEVAA
jgi:hypothetical protein